MPPDESGPGFWIDKARRDLRMAELALEQGNDFTDQVCFHAQQCAEKALNAVLVAAGTVPRRTHDLVAILDEVERVSRAEPWGALRDSAELLSDLGVGPRYPGWDAIDESLDPIRALVAARIVLGAAERHLATRGVPPGG